MKHKKLVVIGSGPAGYTAAIYAARAMLKPTVFTGSESGGQLMYTSDIENFPGFPQGVMGPRLMADLQSQAVRFGSEISSEIITAVDFSQRPFRLWSGLPEGVTFDDFASANDERLGEIRRQIVKKKPDYSAEAIIISTGATSLMSGVPGEKKYKGRGVSTCAVCDAAFFRDRKVFVIGGGDSAMEDSLALAKFTKDVTIIHRRDSFRASRVMQERVLNHPHIKVLWNSQILEVIGDDLVKQIKVSVEGKEQVFEAEGVFLAIGHKPATKVFQDQLQLDEHGYVVTSMSLSKLGVAKAKAALLPSGLVNFPTMTSVEGVFAAGDVVDVRYKQAITAAGQGCAAALDAERWLETQE
ncbi:MAG: NAD(P)/FAD-dependent oxidoreductase [Patescibacteria group bacterium]